MENSDRIAPHEGLYSQVCNELGERTANFLFVVIFCIGLLLYGFTIYRSSSSPGKGSAISPKQIVVSH